MTLLCAKCGPVEETLTPIEEGEPMQCPKCLDFTVESIEELIGVDEEEPKKSTVRIFKGPTLLSDYEDLNE
jgi:hypothetical protein